MLKNAIERFKNSNRLKNITKISSGTLVGQIISFITVPIFTRIYGAEILGIWAFLNAIYLFVNSFSDLGLTYSIMVEKDENKREKIYQILTTIILLFSFIISIIIGIIYTFFKENDTNLNIWFLMIYSLIAIFTLQQVQICYTWLNRNGKYDILMKNPLINNLSFGIIGIILGIIGLKQYGYYIGWIAGQILTLMNMKKYMPKKSINVNIREYKEIFKENLNFVKYQLPTNIINVLKNQLPTFIIKPFFGNTILGYYSITLKILNIPITLLGNAVGRVFFQESTEMMNKGQGIGEFTYRSITKMMKVGAIPMILLISFGKIAVRIFLGEDWEPAGDMLRIVAFQTYFIFLTASVQGISINLKKQKYVMYTYIAQSIGIIISFFIGKFIFDSIYIALLLMVLIFIIINIVYFCKMFIVMEISYKKYLKQIMINFGCILILSIIISQIVDWVAKGVKI